MYNIYMFYFSMVWPKWRNFCQPCRDPAAINPSDFFEYAYDDP